MPFSLQSCRHCYGWCVDLICVKFSPKSLLQRSKTMKESKLVGKKLNCSFDFHQILVSSLPYSESQYDDWECLGMHMQADDEGIGMSISAIAAKATIPKNCFIIILFTAVSKSMLSANWQKKKIKFLKKRKIHETKLVLLEKCFFRHFFFAPLHDFQMKHFVLCIPYKASPNLKMIEWYDLIPFLPGCKFTTMNN